MERVWSQYERMESELSVIRSHLQHICNFGGLQVFQLHILTSLGFQAWLTAFKTLIQTNQKHIYFLFCFLFFYQEQSQAQRELWMMEDILSGLKINRDHFRFLLGLQRHHSEHHLFSIAKLRLDDLCRNFKRISKIELIKKNTHLSLKVRCQCVDPFLSHLQAITDSNLRSLICHHPGVFIFDSDNGLYHTCTKVYMKPDNRETATTQ